MRSLLFVLTLAAIGCTGSSGPPSTTMVSSDLDTLPARIAFLERYVTFRRAYESLDFHIHYRNGGSLSPSPSEWDIRVVAQVPPDELAQWIPPGVKPATTADVAWLADVPNAAAAKGIQEWYAEPRRLVGVDRARNLVAFRVWAN